MSFREKKLTCPYDRNHQILPERMQRHLVLCKKQHPHINLKICLFNSSHHIAPDKWEHHQKVCRDRTDEFVMQHAYNQAQKSAPAAAAQPAAPSSAPPVAKASAAAAAVSNPDEEDWEAEMEGNVPYNPTAVAMSRLVWRNPQTLMTKSERKKFRQEEYVRWNKLKAEGVGSSVNAVDEEATSDKPLLRRPGSTMPAGSNNSDSGAPRPPPVGVSKPPSPPPSAAIGRGRGGGVASSRPLGPPPPPKQRKPWGTSTAGGAASSEAGTFATNDFKSLEDDSIISGNLKAMRMQ